MRWLAICATWATTRSRWIPRARWWRGSPRGAGRRTSTGLTRARASQRRCARPATTGTPCRRARNVVQRYRGYLGLDHTYTLRAAVNLINDRRAVGELARAEELGREILDRCQAVGSPTDLAYAALVSLASVLRAAGEPEEALRYDRQARDGLINAYGDEHPFTLEATINYASDLAAWGDLAAAIRAGQETLARCRGSLGENHPVTLMAAANLALDELASGNEAAAEEMLADALRRYTDMLTTEHPEARAALARNRLTAEIEPY